MKYSSQTEKIKMGSYILYNLDRGRFHGIKTRSIAFLCWLCWSCLLWKTKLFCSLLINWSGRWEEGRRATPAEFVPLDQLIRDMGGRVEGNLCPICSPSSIDQVDGRKGGGQPLFDLLLWRPSHGVSISTNLQMFNFTNLTLPSPTTYTRETST